MGRHVLRADGGARGNPGPAGIGYVIEAPDGTIVSEGAESLGVATNNVAEYRALIRGLERALELDIQELDVRLDSQLVVNQLAGSYKVKNEGLRPLHRQAVELLARLDFHDVRHVPRRENTDADALANRAMDETAAREHADERTDEPDRGAGSDGAATNGIEPDTAGSDAASTGDAKGTYELTVKAHFDAAHELIGYPGECRGLHGHTWDVELTVAGERLDEIGIVYDFKRLKEDLSGALERYDHAMLNEQPPFDTVNPTAENLARVLHEELSERVGPEVRVVEVAVWESPIARIVYRA